MEPFIADLINNPKIPKIIRILIITIVCLFIIILSISCTINSPFILGKIFGIILTITSLIIEVYLYIKILKNK